MEFDSNLLQYWSILDQHNHQGKDTWSKTEVLLLQTVSSGHRTVRGYHRKLCERNKWSKWVASINCCPLYIKEEWERYEDCLELYWPVTGASISIIVFSCFSIWAPSLMIRRATDSSNRPSRMKCCFKTSALGLPVFSSYTSDSVNLFASGTGTPDTAGEGEEDWDEEADDGIDGRDIMIYFCNNQEESTVCHKTECENATRLRVKEGQRERDVGMGHEISTREGNERWNKKESHNFSLFSLFPSLFYLSYTSCSCLFLLVLENKRWI